MQLIDFKINEVLIFIDDKLKTAPKGSGFKFI